MLGPTLGFEQPGISAFQNPITLGGSGPPVSGYDPQQLALVPPRRRSRRNADALPSKAEQEAAKEFLDGWSAASYQFGQDGKAYRDLLRSMYQQRLLLSQWAQGTSGLTADQQVSMRTPSSWRSDMVVSITPIVQNISNRGVKAIFSSDRPFYVEPEDPTRSLEDDDFPTSKKLEQLLNQRLKSGRWKTRLREILQDFTLFDAVFGKLHLYSRTIPKRITNPFTFETDFVETSVYECPIIETVDCDRILVDWEATSSDIQQWHGIGHRVDIPFHRVVQRFKDGIYTLNKDEVFRRWKEGGSAFTSQTEGWRDDRLRMSVLEDKISRLTAWEYHGLVEQPDGTFKEGLMTVLTDREAESTAGGVLVRLQKGTALDCGLRPFASTQFTPLPAPFGMSAVKPHLDKIYYLSQLYNLYIDCVRIGVNPVLLVKKSSGLATRSKAGSGGEKLWPGKELPVNEPGDVTTLQIPLPNLAALVDLIRHFEHMIEQGTGVSDATMGMSGREKTATEAHGLFAALDVPIDVIMDAFSEDFLEPALNIALAMIQQFQLGDLQLSFRGADGMDRPVVITEQEIKTGKYRVHAAMNKQDQTKIAKAQSIERVIPLLAKPEIQQAIMAENKAISLTGMLQRYLELMGIDNIDDIIKQAPPMMPNMGGPPGQPMLPGMPGASPVGPGGAPQLEPGQRPPLQLVRRGGPMGDQPTDQNALAQLLQLMQAGQAPNQLPPGGPQ
jgi:hypothetical protein